MALFTELSFRWDRTALPELVATHSIERVCYRFHRMLPEFVWDAGAEAGAAWWAG